MWLKDDTVNGKEIFEPPWDEVKYVLEGESQQLLLDVRGKCFKSYFQSFLTLTVIYNNTGEVELRDNATGHTMRAGPGSILWFPKGSSLTIVSCQGLKTFYVEAVHRLVSPAEVTPQELESSIETLLVRLCEEYVATNKKSQESFLAAEKLLPGGSTRSVLEYEPFPMVLVSGQGCHVTSEDGRQYVDFVSEYSACTLGHSDPDIAEVVESTMLRGITLGGPSKEEAVLASLLIERIPSFEKVRFCNSGTEANTMALTIALNYTKRTKVGRPHLPLFDGSNS